MTLLLLIIFSSCKPLKEGHYYSITGEKVDGLLRFNYGGSMFKDKSNGFCSVTYQENKNSSKQIFSTKDICCFVIESDSFAIVENIRLNFLHTFPRDFAKVIQHGEIDLFLYYSVIQNQHGPQTVTDWFIVKQNKTEKLNRIGFRKSILPFIEDYPELASKVSGKELGYDNIVQIVRSYNYKTLK